jgi:hypothetical protein
MPAQYRSRAEASIRLMKANCHGLLHERHVGFHTGQPHRPPNRDQPVFLNFCPIVAGQSPVPRI